MTKINGIVVSVFILCLPKGKNVLCFKLFFFPDINLFHSIKTCIIKAAQNL